MPLTHEQVQHIARLARLELSQSEVEIYCQQLTVILDYIDQLAHIDTSALVASRPPVYAGPLRADVVVPSLPVNEALKNAPDTDGSFFKVPKVLG